MSQDSATSNAAAAAHDIKKTGIFAGVAVTCLVITGIVQFVTGPKKIENIGKLGEEFYPDFDDALKVTALDVFAWTEDAVAQTFRVEQQKNGHWVIPSHHSYPVDAHDQRTDHQVQSINRTIIRCSLLIAQFSIKSTVCS